MSRFAFSIAILSSFISYFTWAQSLNLGSDANTIKTKSQAIEAEYSQDFKDDQRGAIIVEDGSSVSPKPAFRGDLHKIPGAKNTYYSGVNSFSYASTLKMREDRKVGVGVVVGGALGLTGISMELNLEDADGVLAGFGTGPGYNSFQLAWKHAFEGLYLAPYTTVGYSKWYNSRGGGDDYHKSDVLDRVLTSTEKIEGRFGTDFVNGSLGLQYNHLAGDFAGLSIFAELTAMYEVKRSVLLPNGAVGAVYYF